MQVRPEKTAPGAAGAAQPGQPLLPFAGRPAERSRPERSDLPTLSPSSLASALPKARSPLQQRRSSFGHKAGEQARQSRATPGGSGAEQPGEPPLRLLGRPALCNSTTRPTLSLLLSDTRDSRCILRPAHRHMKAQAQAESWTAGKIPLHEEADKAKEARQVGQASISPGSLFYDF